MRSRTTRASVPATDPAAAEIARWEQDAVADRLTGAVMSSEGDVIDPALFQTIVAASTDAVIIASKDHSIRYANAAAEVMFQRSRAELLGLSLDALFPAQHGASHFGHVDSIRLAPGHAGGRVSDKGPTTAVRADGTQFPVEFTQIWIGEGQAEGMAAIIRDVTHQRMLEDEIKRLASADPLTGALNRHAFAVRAIEEQDRAVRYGHPLSIAIMDADHFKRINGHFGRSVGDEVLKHIARLIAAELRTTDVLARWSGEAFILLLPHCDVDAAARCAERLRGVIESSPLEGISDRGRVGATFSIGAAELDRDNDTLAALLERAEQALQAAKSNGRNQVFVVPNRPPGTLLV